MVTSRIVIILYAFCISLVQAAAAPLDIPKYINHEGYDYKMHVVPQSWYEAYHYCKVEGGALFYPGSEDDAIVLKRFLQSLPNGKELWVGAHDLFAQNIFVNLNGTEIEEYYAPWAQGEPKNAESTEDCVSMDYYGKINSRPCEESRFFVCKKYKYNTMSFNEKCGTSDIGYVANEDYGSCYKVHRQPKTWTQAYETCRAEGSYLVIINGEQEANYVADAVTSVTPRTHDYNTLYTVVGFHDKFVNGEFLTIHGENQIEVYSKWAEGEPNNIYNDEKCGSIGLLHQDKGLLNDFNCDVEKTVFVCERDIVRFDNSPTARTGSAVMSTTISHKNDAETATNVSRSSYVSAENLDTFETTKNITNFEGNADSEEMLLNETHTES